MAVRFAICIHITDKSKYRELLLKAGEVIAVNRIADAGKGQQVLTQEVQTADRQLGLRQRVVCPNQEGSLIASHILLHRHLVLGDTVCLVQKFLLHRRLVVAKHQDDGRLLLAAEVVHQQLE